MTKRDFELIAAAIKGADLVYWRGPKVTRRMDRHVRHAMAQAFASLLCDTNPRFDRERFLAACEL